MTINFNKQCSTTSSHEFEELTFEYDNLRKEILHNEVISTQLMGFSLAVVAGGMGYVLKSSESPLTKITILTGIIGFLTLVVLQNLDKIRMTFLIASYLKHYIEPKLNNVKWETRLSEFRKENEKEMGRNRYNNVVRTYVIIAVSNLLLMFFYLIKYNLDLKQTNSFPELFNDKITNRGLGLLLICISLIVCLYMSFDARKKFKYFVKNNEELTEKWKPIP